MTICQTNINYYRASALLKFKLQLNKNFLLILHKGVIAIATLCLIALEINQDQCISNLIKLVANQYVLMAVWKFCYTSYIKVTGSVSLCLYQIIKLNNVELILFSFTMYSFIGPGKVYN